MFEYLLRFCRSQKEDQYLTREHFANVIWAKFGVRLDDIEDRMQESTKRRWRSSEGVFHILTHNEAILQEKDLLGVCCEYCVLRLEAE